MNRINQIELLINLGCSRGLFLWRFSPLNLDEKVLIKDFYQFQTLIRQIIISVQGSAPFERTEGE